MMPYPRLVTNLSKFESNVRTLTGRLAGFSVDVMAVTKVFKGSQPLIDILERSDVTFIADSRVSNLKEIRTSKPKVLLRVPMASEVDEVVRFSDISLNSQMQTIKALDIAARAYGVVHGVILMFDIGDLREGIFHRDDYMPDVFGVLSLDNIRLEGIGTNLTCYGGVIPTPETLERLITIKDTIEKTASIRLSVVSGGNSSGLHLLFSGQQPPGITNFRIGEAFVLGRETAWGNRIDDMHDDIFTLEAELVEVRRKPSMPEGLLGMNAFGETVSFEDKGMMTRGIIALGRQDVRCDDLIPPPGIEVLGCSSDHTILHLQDDRWKVGDVVTFKLNYGGILSAFHAKDVRKTYV